MSIRNGHRPATNRIGEIATQAMQSAEAAVIAGVAFRLAVIDQHRIRPGLFDDPVNRMLFVAMIFFRRRNPEAERAPDSQLIRFISEIPELSTHLRRDDAAPTSDTVSPAEIGQLLDAGPYKVDLIKSNVETLRERFFEIEPVRPLSKSWPMTPKPGRC